MGGEGASEAVWVILVLRRRRVRGGGGDGEAGLGHQAPGGDDEEDRGGKGHFEIGTLSAQMKKGTWCVPHLYKRVMGMFVSHRKLGCLVCVFRRSHHD